MATTPVSWPASLPICVRRNAASGGPEDARAAFAPDIGPAITRPRASIAGEAWNIVLDPMTKADFAIFEAFVRDDLSLGAQAFLFPHPITKAPRAWQFAPDAPPYSVAMAPKSYLLVQFRLYGLPLDPWFADYVPANTGRVPAVVADYDNAVFGINGVTSTAAAVALVAGTFDVFTTSDTAVVTEELNHAVLAGDIPATAPANVSKIVAFDP